MKVTTKITYSASKLIKALPKMIEDYIEDSGNSTIENSRDIIKIYQTIAELNSNLLDLLKIVKSLEEKIEDNL